MPHSTSTSATTTDDSSMSPRAVSPRARDGERRDFEDLEARFFDDLKVKQSEEDDRLEYEYEATKAQISVKLEEALREKAALERKLEAVNARVVLHNESLEKLTEDYKVTLAKLATSRRKAYYDMQEHFKNNRDEGSLDVDLITQLRNLGPKMAVVPGEEDERVVVDGDNDLTGASVYHSDGRLIGKIKKVPVGTPVVDILLDLPIKRDVSIRAGRKFNAVNLEPIYNELHGTKPSKWVAFMVQAVGEIQTPPCTTCAKSTGPFAECIKVRGELFGRCGNCEWARQGCHPIFVIPDSQETAATTDVEMKDAPPHSSIIASTNSDVDGRQPLILKKAPVSSQKTETDDKPSTSREPQPVPTGPAGAPETTASSHRPIAPAPPRSEQAATLDDNVEARAKSPAGSANIPDIDPAERELLVNPPLALRDNGIVYTEPELMAGVPVEKIDQNHPYWDPVWKDPVANAKTVLAGYKEKHEACLSDVSGTKSNNKFLLGRQVKRGYTILEFLENGSFSPYQFVAKKWMTPGIITYDTLFRLAATLEELEKFKIKVTPAEWMRQRFYEIMLAEGDQFSLTKTLKDFYRDPKLQALRALCGFGNIGRPSGAKAGEGPRSKSPGSRLDRQRRRERGGASANTSSGGTSRPSKRPKIAGPLHQPQVKQQQQQQLDVLAEAAPTAEGEEGKEQDQNERKQQTATAKDEFAYEGFTDTDSLCGDSVDNDDYKVRQVRTRQHTTPLEGTQYWHFIQGYEDLGTWELHLLQRTNPPDWVRYEPPFNFGVFLDEIIAITHHPDSLKIHVKLTVPEGEEGTEGYVKGEVMTWFKRERTKRRLLASCREKGIAISVAER